MLSKMMLFSHAFQNLEKDAAMAHSEPESLEQSFRWASLKRPVGQSQKVSGKSHSSGSNAGIEGSSQGKAFGLLFTPGGGLKRCSKRLSNIASSF
jgi:hypothetical protein